MSSSRLNQSKIYPLAVLSRESPPPSSDELRVREKSNDLYYAERGPNNKSSFSGNWGMCVSGFFALQSRNTSEISLPLPLE